MFCRHRPRFSWLGPVTGKLPVAQEATNAAKENARTGDSPAKIRMKLHSMREEMEKTWEKLLKPKHPKIPEKFYKYPWEVQMAMVNRQLQFLRGDHLGPVTAKLQAAQDVKDRQKEDLTNAGRENVRNGKNPAKIRPRLRIARREMAKKPTLRLRERLHPPTKQEGYGPIDFLPLAFIIT